MPFRKMPPWLAIERSVPQWDCLGGERAIKATPSRGVPSSQFSLPIYRHCAAMKLFSRVVALFLAVCAIQVAALPTPDADKRDGKLLSGLDNTASDRLEPI